MRAVLTSLVLLALLFSTLAASGHAAVKSTPAESCRAPCLATRHAASTADGALAACIRVCVEETRLA